MNGRLARSEIARRPVTDAAYANAKVRGMRSRLLSRAFMEQLAAAPDFAQVAKELLRTGYGADLERAFVHGLSATAVDEALLRNAVRTSEKVLSLFVGAPREVLSALLARWDVFNIKTVLRGVRSSASADEIRASLFPVGSLSAVDLEGLARAGDVSAVIDTLAVWGLPYATPLRLAYPEFARGGELAPLELALDRQYAEWAAGQIVGSTSYARAARRILGMQVDTANLVTAFRLLRAQARSDDPARYFLEGGRAISRALYLELVRGGGVAEALDRLKSTPYGPSLESAIVSYLRDNSITVLERALEEGLVRRALKSGYGDTEGVGSAIALLYGHENEITNLRIIARGKAVGMPPERIEEALILA